MSIVEAPVAPTTEIGPVYTRAEVFERAAELVEKRGVGEGPDRCILRRLAEAHEEVTGGLARSWRESGDLDLDWCFAARFYFGGHEFVEAIWKKNDTGFWGFFGGRRRKRWAAAFLRERAAAERAL